MDEFQRTLNPFGVCFTSMKMKYQLYDQSLKNLNVGEVKDCNVFINFESVMTSLSLIRDLESKLLLERKFTYILESEMINLCAHYRRFFRDNGCNTKVYLYYTDLTSDTFSNFIFNDEYRSYYLNKFLKNPKFQLLGNNLVDTIIPRVKKILEFIPGVYFISAKNIEGSMVPLILAKENKDAKNFIITGERYDTQYTMYPSTFIAHFFKRSPLNLQIIGEPKQCVADLFKDNEQESDNNGYELFRNPSFYSTLMSVMGDKKRSVDPLKGVGCKTVQKYLNNGIDKGLVTKDTNTIELISSVFPEEYHDLLINNFRCISLESQYLNLTEQDRFNITNQIVDRSDYSSLLELNKSDYKDYPLMLTELTQ